MKHRQFNSKQVNITYKAMSDTLKKISDEETWRLDGVEPSNKNNTTPRSENQSSFGNESSDKIKMRE